MEETEKKDIQDIRQRITSPKYPSLTIGRIPLNVFEGFTKLAKDEFCEDYGFTLKFLYDFYVGLIPSGVEHLEDAIERLNLELNALKNKPDEEKKIRTRLDGKRIEGG